MPTVTVRYFAHLRERLAFLCVGIAPDGPLGLPLVPSRGLFFAGSASEKFGGISHRCIIPADQPFGAGSGN
jgi:hypothetical protein